MLHFLLRVFFTCVLLLYLSWLSSYRFQLLADTLFQSSGLRLMLHLKELLNIADVSKCLDNYLFATLCSKINAGYLLVFSFFSALFGTFFFLGCQRYLLLLFQFELPSLHFTSIFKAKVND